MRRITCALDFTLCAGGLFFQRVSPLGLSLEAVLAHLAIFRYDYYCNGDLSYAARVGIGVGIGKCLAWNIFSLFLCVAFLVLSCFYSKAVRFAESS